MRSLACIFFYFLCWPVLLHSKHLSFGRRHFELLVPPVSFRFWKVSHKYSYLTNISAYIYIFSLDARHHKALFANFWLCTTHSMWHRTRTCNTHHLPRLSATYLMPTIICISCHMFLLILILYINQIVSVSSFVSWQFEHPFVGPSVTAVCLHPLYAFCLCIKWITYLLSVFVVGVCIFVDTPQKVVERNALKCTSARSFALIHEDFQFAARFRSWNLLSHKRAKVNECTLSKLSK